MRLCNVFKICLLLIVFVFVSFTNISRSDAVSFTPLGYLPGGSFSSNAEGVSADGSVVVGVGSSASGSEAFIWDNTNGMRNLMDVLISEGVSNLTGWTLTHARDISDDGLTIVGYGSGPSGTEAWLATLDAEPIPEPATIALLGIGLAGLAGTVVRRRFRRKAKS